MQVRWAESVKVLDGKLKGLVGNTLVSAAAVAYLGPLTLSYRQELVAKWVHMLQGSQVPISHRFDLIHSMSEANEVRRRKRGVISFLLVCVFVKYIEMLDKLKLCSLDL